jgi:hypothetical protein
MEFVEYWNGEADAFPKKIAKRRWAVPAVSS